MKFPLILCLHLLSNFSKRKSQTSDLYFIPYSSCISSKKEHSREGISERLAHFFLQTSSNTMTQSFEREKKYREIVNEKFNFFFVLQESHGSVRRSVICNGMENSFYCVSETVIQFRIIYATNITWIEPATTAWN